MPRMTSASLGGSASRAWKAMTRLWLDRIRLGGEGPATRRVVRRGVYARRSARAFEQELTALELVHS